MHVPSRFAKIIILVGMGLFSSTWSSVSEAAEFYFEPFDQASDLLAITLYGDIASGDAATLEAAAAEAIGQGHQIDIVNLFSRGGDAFEGILLGETIRDLSLMTNGPLEQEGQQVCIGATGEERYSANVNVYEPCVCASACAIAWLGGVQRMGDVLFHRAYSFTNGRLPRTDDQQAFRMYLREYTERMNAPGFVWERMNSAGPSEVAPLTPEERDVVMLAHDFEDTATLACEAFNVDRRLLTEWISLNYRFLAGILADSERQRWQQLTEVLRPQIICWDQIRRQAAKEAQWQLWEAANDRNSGMEGDSAGPPRMGAPHEDGNADAPPLPPVDPEAASDQSPWREPGW